MTPIIDIVFLLIIFFLVVCQFIEAENFPVDVPAGCDNAACESTAKAQPTTVTVIKSDEGGADFAVGAQKIAAGDKTELIREITRLIDQSLADFSGQEAVVTLRIDRDVCYRDAQYALAAVAASGAEDIRLASKKSPQNTDH